MYIVRRSSLLLMENVRVRGSIDELLWLQVWEWLFFYFHADNRDHHLLWCSVRFGFFRNRKTRTGCTIFTSKSLLFGCACRHSQRKLEAERSHVTNRTILLNQIMPTEPEYSDSQRVYVWAIVTDMIIIEIYDSLSGNDIQTFLTIVDAE